MNAKAIIINEGNIQDKIFTIRGIQVILDKDLAFLYQIETRVLKQSVRRNMKCFPGDFLLELTNTEMESLVSQSVIPSKQYFGGAKPFAFTEQGVAMLSSVLKSDIAIKVNIKIMRTFISMRRFMVNNATIFHRLDSIEHKQLVTDTKLDQVFEAIESKDITPTQGIFFDGQVFDAHVFVSGLVKKAKSSILLIDNYIDETVLVLLSKRRRNCSATIYTKNISKQLQLDLKNHNEQYSPITIKLLKNTHDRFLILDNKTVYHIGASLKDLGKKWFAFSKFDTSALMIMERLKDCDK